ncbi:glycosyltransferase [Micromonospora sp. M12]
MSGHLWSVITVTYNSADTLRRCWGNAHKPYEWIVVDNNSADDSVAVAEELGARVVRLPENVGFSKANNVGVRHVTSEYVLFANPDLEVGPDGFATLQGHLDAHGGLVAPQLLGTDGTPQPNGRGFRTPRRSWVTGRSGRCHRCTRTIGWWRTTVRPSTSPGSWVRR